MARKKTPDAVAIQNATQAQRLEAWRAIQKFNELKPQLTNFARNVTGNSKVEVHATASGAYSKGNKIFIRPPLGLGRDYGHSRRDCGVRGEDGRQICEACRVREVVDFYLNHEIGHVWLGSQVAPNDDDFDIITDAILEWHPSNACSHAHPLIRDLQREADCMGVCAGLSEYVSLIWNALEDARVNEGMFNARPGLRRIFEVNINRLMTEGIEVHSGESVTWMDAPADSQFVVGLSMMACDYEIGDWLHPAVIEALRDERLVDITSRARMAGSAHEVTEYSVQCFVVAQELGYCVVPKCQPKPEELEQPNPLKDSEDGQRDESSGQSVSLPSPGGTGSNDGEASSGEGTSGGSGKDPGTESAKGEPQQEGSGSEDNVPEGSGPSGDEEAEVQQTDDSTDAPATSSDDSVIHPDDAEESDDGSGSEDTEGPGAGGNTSELDESADDAEAVDGGGNLGEDDSSGRGSESDGEDATSGASGGSPVDGSDESSESGEQPVSNSIGNGDISDPGNVSSDGDGGRSDDPSEDRDGDEGDPGVGGDGTSVSTEESTGSDESGSEDDSPEEESNQLDEPENPWDIEGPGATGRYYGPVPQSGSIEDIERLLMPFLMHGIDDSGGMIEDMLGEELAQQLADIVEDSQEFFNATPLVSAAIMQVLYFDDPSINVAGVDVAKFPSPEIGWEPGEWKPLTPSETIVGAAVLHARRVFEENRRSHFDRNRTSGKVNTRVLAKRAPVGDPRLFGKKTQPKKRSYLVIITGDCSASTSSYGRNAKIRRLMMAQGDILHRTGVPFIMMGHSASNIEIKNFRSSRSSDYWMYVLPIKQETEGWGPVAKSRLAGMKPVSENLDGHTLEYCRKLADRSQATDVIIIYYTDGEMPASNYTEERTILEREISTCKRKGYHLLAVGIETDSPEQYGMKTVRVDSDEDAVKVIKQLEEVLTK